LAESYSVDAILSADNTGMLQAFREAASASRDLSSALNNIDTSAMDQAARDVQTAGRNIEDVGRMGQQVGGNLTKWLTVPIVGVGAAAVKTGGDFEKSMSQVEAVSGATADEMETLETVARKMGRETAFSASEASEALNYMALSGWNTEEMASALPDVLNLAAAGSLDLGQAANIVSNNMTAFGIEAEKASEVSDVLAYAQSNANTSVDELGEAFVRAAPAASSAGQSIETTTAILSMFADQGLVGSAAGTALNAVIRDMVASAEDGAIAIGDTSVAVYDAEGNMRSLTDIMQDVEAATADLNDEQRDSALTSVWQQQGIAGVNLLLNQGTDELADFEEALFGSSGTAEEMADIMQDNLWGALTALSSALSELAIQIFNMVEPALRVIVEGATAVVRWLQNIPGPVKAVIGVFAVLVAAIGPILVAIGTLISMYGIFLQAKAAIILQGGFMATMLGKLSAAFAALTGPIGLAIGAVIAAAIAIGTLYATNEDFRDFVSGAWESIQSAISSAVDMIVGGFQNLNDWIADLDIAFNSLMEVIAAVAPIVMALFGPVGMLAGALTLLFTQTDIASDMMSVFKGEMEFSEAIDNMIDMVSQWASNLQEMGMMALEAGSEIIMSLIQGLQENLPQWLETALTVIENFVQQMQQNAPIILQQGLEMLQSLIEGIISAIPMIADVVVQIIEMYVNNFVTMLPVVVETGLELLMSLIEGITAALPQLLMAAIQVITTLIGGLLEALPRIIEVATSIISTLVEGITTALPLIIGAAIMVITTLIGGLIEALPQIIQAAIQVVTALVEGIAQALPVIIQAAIQIITTLIQVIVTALPQIIEAGIQVLLALVDGIIQVLPVLIEAAIQIITSLLQVIVQALPQLLEAGVQILLAVIAGITQLLPQLIMAGIEIIMSLITGIIQMLPQILMAGAEIVISLISGIVQLIPQIISAAVELVVSFAGAIITEGPKMLWEAGKGIVGSVVDGIKGFFSSGEVEAAGGETVDRFSQGIDDTQDTAVSSMENLSANVQGVADQIPPNMGTTFDQLSPTVGNSLDLADASAGSGMSVMNSTLDTGFNTAVGSAETSMSAMDATIDQSFSNMSSSTSTNISEMSSIIDSGTSNMSSSIDVGTTDMQSTLSSGLSDMTANIDGETSNMLSTLSDNMSEMSSTADNSMADISSSTSDEMSNAQSAVQESMSAMASDVTSQSSQMVNRITSAMRAFASQIQSGMNNSLSVLQNGLSQMVSTVNSYVSSMRSAGVNLANGLASGIRAGQSSAINAAGNMARSALSRAQSVLGIQSPSREFMEVGEFSGEGAAIGLENATRKAVNAAAVMANRMQQAFNPELAMPNITGQISRVHRQAQQQMSYDYQNELSVNSQPIYINNVIELDGERVAESVNEVNAINASLRKF